MADGEAENVAARVEEEMGVATLAGVADGVGAVVAECCEGGADGGDTVAAVFGGVWDVAAEGVDG